MLWIRTLFPVKYSPGLLSDEPTDLARDGANLSEEIDLVDILKSPYGSESKSSISTLYKDKMRQENHISGCDPPGCRRHPLPEMAEVWHRLPHITVSQDDIVFGPSMEMVPDQPKEPGDREEDQIDPTDVAESSIHAPEAPLDATFASYIAPRTNLVR
ncbi:hypothetical protein BGZ81_002277 [Podila clonocystis]|nr:hypothetical protein BGZ81_002277 [Podila clonocystis]